MEHGGWGEGFRVESLERRALIRRMMVPRSSKRHIWFVAWLCVNLMFCGASSFELEREARFRHVIAFN